MPDLSWEEKRKGFYIAALEVSDEQSLPSKYPRPLDRLSVPHTVTEKLKAKGFEVSEEGIVRWAKDSLTHPRRWSLLRKCYDSAIIIFLECFMTLVSNTGSSIAPFAAKDFDIDREMALFCLTTVYLIGQAIGGLIFPPIAESFGGRTIYVSSTIGFALFCLIMAAYPTIQVMVLCRFITGLLSAMPCVVATGSIENMWDMTSRTFLIHIWIAGAVVGLAVGPPLATFISTSPLGWTWVFYMSAAVTGAAALLCFPMQESRPCQVLRQQVKAVSRETSFTGLSFDGENCLPSAKTFIQTSLWLPIRLFLSEPIILLTSVMAATVYGIVYLFSESLSIVYLDGYGFSIRRASLVILAIAVGVGFSFLPRIYDVHITRLRREQNVQLQPEDKLFGFYVAAPVGHLTVGFNCSPNLGRVQRRGV